MNDQLIPSNIVNISEGGLQFILRKSVSEGLKEGDILNLTRIKGRSDLEFRDSIQMEIRWILALNYFEHIGIGCQFKEPPESLKERIKKFIEAEAV